ncbi:ABC-type dipeptide/oligopeptide/nickel transport system permease subunit [Phyllobacterium trifolii]|uniref:ABC-type dipeptide/oligopeptide/nickel transport system permease subunit n=1 Tax=Phyllobacterium trifolii TaxID=300193 RepID=A0A839UCV8_9HYPH|nr:ABC transporter permease [Phyllobacterium trifolii]MBB3148377.1 ABC-type dipeptide/oligopeptide/nickel transport system permease subunit [Phyllobacterium trifolii]
MTRALGGTHSAGWRAHWRFILGLGIAIFLAAAALLAPWVAPFEPNRMAVGPRLAAPSARFIFGTDEFGRDLFSRVLVGARLSLGIGICAVAGGLLVGGLIGLAAAFSGRIIEVALLRAVDFLYALPDTLIALSLVAFLGPGTLNVATAIAAGMAPVFARTTYGLAAVERGKPYVEAASLATTGPFRLVRVHVMPNIVQSVAVMATLGVSSAVLAAAGLSFLGLGVQPPAPEWGLILVSGANYMNKAPWILFFPGLAICLTALSLNLIGDGLRDMSDPRGGRTS